MTRVQTDAAANDSGPTVSVVMPCLNEATTIAACIEEAVSAFQNAGWSGEVVVADNGSTDGSREVAEAAGGRVVPVPVRGYGAALDTGIRAARGRVVVFADADGSYPFSQLADLVRPVLDGAAQFVLGSRLGGSIEAGAMPVLHRRLGTPVLSWLIRRLYGLPTSDCNSGMRAFRRSVYPQLQLRCPGMEYASEMLIRVAQCGLEYLEVPLAFRRDRRDRPPHLSTWSDGWRHLRFILGQAPSRVLIAPLGVLAAVATVVAFVLSFVPTQDDQLRFHSAFSLLAVAAPMAALCFTLLMVKAGAHNQRTRLVTVLNHLADRSWLIAAALGAYAVTALQLALLVVRWYGVGFGDLFAMAEVIRLMVLSSVGTAFLALDVGLGLTRLYAAAPDPAADRQESDGT